MKNLINPIMGGLFGQNGGGGIFESMLGGLIPRAHGGPMTAGVPYLAGERGPEMIVPRTQMHAVSPWQQDKAGRGGTQQVVNIDARGADAGVMQRLAGAMAAQEQQRSKQVEQSRSFAKRFPMRA